MRKAKNKVSRTAAEAGWHTSCHNLLTPIPGSKMVAIANLHSGICAEYNPLEMYVMNSLDDVSENHPLINRLAKRGVIVNFDESETVKPASKLECTALTRNSIAGSLCSALACNLECPYCYA